MAKIVIAGQADCPYYARAELLGDKLSINLPDFQLHKIVKGSEEWTDWLNTTCAERGWSHGKSPVIWRELIDRGGKGVLIGGANEFQEYAHGYYGIESTLVSDDMRNIAKENLQHKTITDEEENCFKALSKPLHVCITNASSNVCYGMLDMMGCGDVFGSNTELVIHLLDNKVDEEYINGVMMELQDLGHGLVRGIHLETDANVAFKDAEAIVLLDDVLTIDKTREECVKEYAELLTTYAKVINEVAKKSVKVLVAGSGPVNLGAYMAIKNAPSIPRQNFAAMSRLVENHAKAVIAERLHVNTAGVVDLIVWGNPSGKLYVDIDKSRVHGYDGAITGPDWFSVSAPEMVYDKKWLETEYLELVSTRQVRAEVAMQHQATLSQAVAINTSLKHWFNGSPSGQMFSLGVCSEGWYGIPKDLVFSFPVTFHPKGYWNVVQDIDLNDEVKVIIHDAIKDLQSEIDIIFPKSRPSSPDIAGNQLAQDASSNQSGNQTSDDKKDGLEVKMWATVDICLLEADSGRELFYHRIESVSRNVMYKSGSCDGDQRLETIVEDKLGEKSISDSDGESSSQKKDGSEKQDDTSDHKTETPEAGKGSSGTEKEEQLPTE